ncbi:Uncharacterized protein GBIM_05179 [Gryllus bimaculatus]|nr:Uncharacterized protein GBIM_05179 [Gryllus bimaculatus]
MDTENVVENYQYALGASKNIDTGLKKVYHGITYQVHWLMHVALQSLMHNSENFTFRSEENAAGKFDDIVWSIKDDKVVRHNFLQAKHCKRKGRKIKIKELILPQIHQGQRNPFALWKYFISYRDVIKKNLPYDNIIDNLIIATNIDMHYELKQNFKQVENNNQILSIFNAERRYPSTKSENPFIWRLDLNSPLFKEIHQTLEGTYDLIKIAKTLADCVHDDKKFELANNLQQYEYTLLTNIVNQENQFSDNFITGKNLTQQLQNLRNSFYKEAFEKRKKRNLSANNKIINPKEFAKELALLIKKSKGKTVVIRGKGIIKENIYKLSGYLIIEENGSFVFWINDDDENLAHASIKLFKSYFINALEQLSVADLHNYKLNIKGTNPETGKKFETCKKHLLTPKLFWDYVKGYRKFTLPNSSSNLITTENTKPLPAESLVSIDREITEFMDKLIFAPNYGEAFLSNYVKGKLAEELEFLPDKKYVDMFEKELSETLNPKCSNKVISNSDGVRQSISEIKQLVYRASLSLRTVKYRNIIVTRKIQFKQEAVEQQGVQVFLNDPSKQILKIITSQNKLSCIKLHQYFTNSSKYEKQDSFLFLRSDNLNSSDLQQRVLEVFKSKLIDLLVIENQHIKVDSLQAFWRSIIHVLVSESKKKVIMIGENQETSYLNLCPDTVQLQNDENNSLIDLSEESQQHILANSSIKFQGKSVKLSSLPDSRHIFGAEMLSKLIEEVPEEDSVGIKPPCLSDLESMYYFPCLIINEEQLRNSVHNNPKDIFVFKGVTEEEICKIMSFEEKNHIMKSKYSSSNNQFQYIQNDKISRKAFKEICCNYLCTNKVNPMHLIEKEKNCFIWKQTFDSSIYISRELTCRVINHYALKQFVENSSSTDDIFIIMGNKKETQIKISTLETILIDVDSVNTSKMKTNDIGKKYVLTNDNSDNYESFFNSVCSSDALQSFNIHWLQDRSGKLLWRRTRGRIIHLQDLISETDKYVINENEFREIVYSEKHIVIAGEPGIGKTTSLIHIIKSFEKDEWIIKLSLVNIQDHLENYSCTNHIDPIVKILLLNNGVKLSDIEEIMLKNRIKNEGYISIIFDGFDEITSKNQEKVIHLLSVLKDTKSKLIITTRLNAKDKLENSLSVFSYSFQPFSKEDQKEFLQVFWNASMKFTASQKLNKNLLSKQVNNFQNHILNHCSNDLLSIPFLIKSIAEMYQPEIEQKCTLQYVHSEENLTKLGIYEKIVEKRYENFFNEKIAEPNNSAYIRKIAIQNFNVDHQHLAFHKLYSNCEQAKELLNILNLKLPDDLEELKLIGLIQSSSSSETFNFIHQTFAEYFVACFFTNLLQHKTSDSKYELIQSFLLREFFRDQNKEMCDFLENMIQHSGNNNLKSKLAFIKSCDFLHELESKKILQVSHSSSTKRAQDDLSLLEVQQKVESHISWFSSGSCYYYDDDINLDDMHSLIMHFLDEKDLSQLKGTFEFFMKINSKSKLWKLNEYLKFNMNRVVLHYFRESQKQKQKMNKNTLNFCAQIIHEFINNQALSFDKIVELLSFHNTEEHTCTKKIAGIEQFLTLLYKDKDLQWLERKGIFVNTYFMILTLEMSKIYISPLENPNIRNSGWGVIYAKNILNHFLIPILDLLKGDHFHKFDEQAIIRMLTYFIDFCAEKCTHVSISPEQLHTAINLIESMLDKKSNDPDALTVCSEFCIVLKKAGIKTMLANHKLLFLDPASEFLCSFSVTDKKITDLIKWRLINLDKSQSDYFKAAWELFYKKRNLKRSLSDNGAEDPKRFKH